MEKLINEIYLRPAIWDRRSDEYTNKVKNKSSWEEVTDAFVNNNIINVEEVEEKKKR